MRDVSGFWKNLDLHDATILISADRHLLEQNCQALQTTRDLAMSECYMCKQDSGSREATAGTGRINPADAMLGQVLTIPVHQIILSTHSVYFKTAISKFMRARADVGKSLARPLHPIIAVCEEDVEAAEGVLRCIYTQKVDSVYHTAPQLMQMMLVSKRIMCCRTGCTNCDHNHNQIYQPGV